MIDVVGMKFGRLTVVNDDGMIDGYRRVTAECECEAGAVKQCRLASLRNGDTASCGCIRREMHATHGMEGTKIYRAWDGMRQRCNPSGSARRHRPSYLGITHCPEWATFEGFLAHPPPGEFIDGVTVLGRIGDVGDYSPSNARWITKGENTREANLKYFIDGVPAVDIARSNGISGSAMISRIRLGWTIEDAVSLPITGRPYKKKSLNLETNAS